MVASWPDRLDDLPFYPAPFLLAAALHAAQTRLARRMSGFWSRQMKTFRHPGFPEMPCMKRF